MAQLDLLSFITDIIGRRNQTSEAAAERAARLNEFDLRFKNDVSQQGLAQSNYERQLAEQKAQQQIANLGTLSNLVGQGTKNVGQADILSLLASRLGNPMSAVQFLNASNIPAAGGGGAAGGSVGGGKLPNWSSPEYGTPDYDKWQNNWNAVLYPTLFGKK